MDDISSLKQLLAKGFSNAICCDTFGKPELMSKALADVRSLFEIASTNYSERSIEKTLHHFRRLKELPTSLDVKYACFGVCQPIGSDAWRLIDDHNLFQMLLQKVNDEQRNLRRFRKYYQGLLQGYFTYKTTSEKASSRDLKNWWKLRSFLKEKLYIVQKANTVVSWVQVLTEHINLLGAEPCKRYGMALLRDDYIEFTSVCDGLCIPRESWVREDTILAHMKAACALGDDNFKEHLEQAINIVMSKSDITLSDGMKKRCISHLVRRYAECEANPEHEALRDASIVIIGNPWLHRVAWDSYVNDNNAREMVDGWIKKRLITDFFQLLSEDGSTDERRLNYWLRYAPVISDMWFALGPHARRHQGSQFKEMRNRARGRLLNLDKGGNVENNAFIMRIDEYILVEFGVIGNACFVFKSDNLPFNLDNDWIRGDDYNLKSSKNIDRLLHQDSPGRRLSWEEKFDSTLQSYFSWKPDIPANKLDRRFRTSYAITNPSSQPVTYSNSNVPWRDIYNLISRYDLEIQDNRKVGGAFWVKIDNKKYGHINYQLYKWGFKYKEGKGWWKE